MKRQFQNITVQNRTTRDVIVFSSTIGAWKRGYSSPSRFSATRIAPGGRELLLLLVTPVSATGNSIQHAWEIKLLFASLPIAQFIYGKVVRIICFFCTEAGNLPVSKVSLTMLMMWERKNGENSRFPLALWLSRRCTDRHSPTYSKLERPGILSPLQFDLPVHPHRTLGTRNQSFKAFSQYKTSPVFPLPCLLTDSQQRAKQRAIIGWAPSYLYRQLSPHNWIWILVLSFVNNIQVQ